MSPEDQDLKFWEAAKISNSQPLWTAPWLFDGSKLYICTSEVIEEVLITSTAEIELAIFDVICLFWQTIALMLKTDTYTWTMARYHCDLHDDVSRRLCGGAWKGQHSEIPASLRPWLARTLFMHQHDEESREAFRSVKVPEYLLPFGRHLKLLAPSQPYSLTVTAVTTAITSDKKFQHYIEPFVSYILRDMGWKSVGPRRSWEVGFIRELCPRPEHQPSDWKGIAILPIEYALQPWEVYFTHGDIKRQLTKSGTLTSISIYRLRGREWVNDDVINAYVACMPLRDGILVLNSYFANHIKERKKSRIIRNMVRRCCSYHAVTTNDPASSWASPLTWMTAWNSRRF